MKNRKIITVLLVLLFLATSVSAQTTAFNYQGKLSDMGTPQNAYQMNFALYDSAVGGSQIGATIENPSVAVNQGVFSVQLDFGANVFTGADRFLQISVRRNSGESYTVLSPREKIASSPYSVRTLSAAQADVALNSQKLGGTAANQFVQTDDARLINDRNPSPNSSNYIQNRTTQQTDANFNIDGGGIVGGSFGVGAITPRAKLDVAGNAVQDLSANGFVKAMALISVTQNQIGQSVVSVIRCYNSILNSSNGSCGFTPQVSQVTGGFRVDVNFGFTVNDRFISATGINLPGNVVFTSNVGAVSFLNSTTVRTYINTTGEYFVLVF